MSEITKLYQHIDEIEKTSDKEFRDTLVDRKLKEMEFHDRDRDRARVEEAIANDTYEKFYAKKNTIKQRDVLLLM